MTRAAHPYREPASDTEPARAPYASVLERIRALRADRGVAAVTPPACDAPTDNRALRSRIEGTGDWDPFVEP